MVKINGVEFKLSPTGIKLVRKVTGKSINFFILQK